MRGATRVSRPVSLLVSLLPCALLLSSAPAQAAGGKRIGVPKFEGAQEAAGPQGGDEVAEGARLRAGRLARHGRRRQQHRRRLDSRRRSQKLAKELSLSAIVTGEVGTEARQAGRPRRRRGSILGDGSFSGANPRKLATEVGLTFWKKLGPDVGRGHVPAGAKKPSSGGRGARGRSAPRAGEVKVKPRMPSPRTTPRASERSPPPTKEAPKKKTVEDEDGGARGALGAASRRDAPGSTSSWGMGGLNRGLTFNQNLNSGLLSYTLGMGPVAVANVVMYPLAPLVRRRARQHRPGGGAPAGLRHLVDAGNGGTRPLQEHRARLRRRRALPLPVWRAAAMSICRRPPARTPSPSPDGPRRTCS